MNGRILAVDPGEKHIGIAISDESGSLARGLTVISHVSLASDCDIIIKLARDNEVKLIVVGNVTGDEGEERPQTRHALKLAAKLVECSGLKVELWDEDYSTRRARAIRLETGSNKKKRGGHLDSVAAAVILQDWLDSNLNHGKEN